MPDAKRDDVPFASEFPAATREAWSALVDATLKGRDFEKLVAKTYDGLALAPLHERARDAPPVPARASEDAWHVMGRVELPDAEAANAEALHELGNGADGLALVFAGSGGDHGYGLPATADALARVLDGVHLDAGIAIDLDVSANAAQEIASFVAVVEKDGVAPASIAVRFGLDPLGVAATRGGPTDWSAAAPGFADQIRALAARRFAAPFAAADGRGVHAAGGSEAQELGFVLAIAAAYLRALEAGGVPVAAAARAIFFRLAADADQFLTIAKFRALRLLWARLQQACGMVPQPAFVAAETAWRMLTRRDPHVNLLRATVATFSAALGGADAVTVLPFTTALGLPDRFARRLARNTQLILREESHIARVADPAAGSGAIEDVTAQLCAAAWSFFQEIERAGGAAAAIDDGLLRERIATTRAAREKSLALRRQVLTGTSEFPFLAEHTPDVLDAEPSALPTAAALPRWRLAEPFEKFRDESNRMLAATGARPCVFLATLGRPADFITRAGFAAGLFESGGIAALGNDRFAGIDEMVAGFAASGARLACLCGSDETYAGEAAAAARALAAAGAAHIWLAGRPGPHEAAWRAAGIGSFVFAGCDALATLAQAYDILRATDGARR